MGKGNYPKGQLDGGLEKRTAVGAGGGWEKRGAEGDNLKSQTSQVGGMIRRA